MRVLSQSIEDLIIQLFEIGCINFGEFILKSGIKSPVYFDLRLLISYPSLLENVSEAFSNYLNQNHLEYDIICGVPYGAISLATSVSLKTKKPMIFKRKESKSHGTQKMIEGVYAKTDRCLIIDDVITSGISILETVESLRKNDCKVNDAIVLLDREQGGFENISNSSIQLHSILKTNDILNTLFKAEKISKDIYEKTKKFLEDNKHVPTTPVVQKQLDFESRAKLTKNKIAKKLFEIMSSKCSNLCLAADYTSFDELLKSADELGPYICILKTHIDILNDFNLDKVQSLVDLSFKHNFLIFEDRKFADIGNTVKHQYSDGIYKISQWADIVNCHSISGPGCIKGLKEAGDYSNKACLLIAQLSSKDNLITDNYVKETVKQAEDNADFVIGFICQKNVSNNPGFIHFSPGIQFNESSDGLGQQYNTPESSILVNKCDIIVVGRGITNSQNPVETAINYRNRAYDAYLKRIN